MQVVKPFCRIPLRLRDISAHPGADLEAQAYSFVQAEILKPFDLKNGPLIRATLLRLGPQHHILISTMHHIVSDGWSAELFVQELAEHYGAFSADRELSLNPLPMQYFDFTILQQRMIPGDRIQEQLSFWQRTLAGAWIRGVFTRRTATQDYIWNVIWDAVIAHGNDKAFDGEILLFRAIRASGFVDVATGWDRIGALRIFDVPGYHESFFSNPVAQAIIRGVLEDAQRRIPASRLESESNAQLRTDRR